MNIVVAGESYDVRFKVDVYDYGCLHVRLATESGIPVATLSLSGKTRPAGEDCFWLKDYAENAEIVEQLLRHGYLERTGVRYRLTFGWVPEARLTALGLAESDDLRPKRRDKRKAPAKRPAGAGEVNCAAGVNGGK